MLDTAKYRVDSMLDSPEASDTIRYCNFANTGTHMTYPLFSIAYSSAASFVVYAMMGSPLTCTTYTPSDFDTVRARVMPVPSSGYTGPILPRRVAVRVYVLPLRSLPIPVPSDRYVRSLDPGGLWSFRTCSWGRLRHAGDVLIVRV